MKSSIFRKVAIPVILISLSTAFTYLLLELFFFRYFLPILPIKTHIHLDEGMRILAQSSKKSVIPKDYIAIVGDSYALGMGDWLLNSNKNKNPDFHSAHIIHKRTGRDVISFGAAGASSLSGLVIRPILQFQYINASYLYEMEPPRIIVVYFYEGNDLNDNLRELRLHYKGKFDKSRIYDPLYFRNFIKDTVIKGHHLYWSARSFGLKDNLFVAKFTSNLINEYFFGEKHLHESFKKQSAGDINKILLNGQIISIPDGLQSPSLELNDDELKLTVYMFEQALLYLHEYFPSSKMGIVYIPSPLSSYKLASRQVKIKTYENRDVIYDKRFVRERSDKIYSLIKNVAEKNNISIMDSRSYIWEYSGKRLVHGPFDWKHFNKEGYTALSEAVMELLVRMNKDKE